MSLIGGCVHYKTKHFTARELLPPSVFNDRGEKAWELLDPRALKVLDMWRDHVGQPVSINSNRLKRFQAGLRVPSQPEYRTSSQHSYGRAFDLKDTDWRDFYHWILEGYLSGCSVRHEVTFIEADTAGYCHFDVRNSPILKVWSPTRGYLSLEDIEK